MERLLEIYRNTIFLKKILFLPRMIYDFFWLRVLSDKQHIQIRFYQRFGYKLNLDAPKSLNEKIQWLKLYDRTPLHTLCADKLLVRDFIKNEIGEEYLVPLILHTNSPEEISAEVLPDFPVIIKTNHDSGNYFIIRDKELQDFKIIKKRLKKALKKNYYYASKEWQYKNIKPCIVVEKLLMRDNGSIPYDYKIHCFNGNVELISVDLDRGGDKHCRNWYGKDWIKMPFKWSSEIKGRMTDPSSEDVKRPSKLDEMVHYSEILSKHFCYVRVDWYEVDGKLYFGELTFHHDSGFRPFSPLDWDLKLGNKLKLPINE